jgi:hypothetical protein
MTVFREQPIPNHFRRQIKHFVRALESLPQGTTLYVTRVAHGLLWQSVNQPVPQPKSVMPPSQLTSRQIEE